MTNNITTARKTKVFISYCYDDVKNYRARLNYIKHKLESLSNDIYDIHMDISDVGPGDSINQYMLEMASAADVGVVVMGPQYRNRVVNLEGGVFKEFNILYQRYEASLQDDVDEKRFCLIPVLFCGTPETAVMNEIKNVHFKDLTEMYVQDRNGKPILVPRLESIFAAVFNDIDTKVKSIHLWNQKAFKRARDKYFRALFINTKSNWDQEEYHDLIERLFVKTKVYEWVSDGEVNFIIGRKGSGKSTITHVLPVRESERFNLKIPIEVNEFYLDAYYNLFIHSAFKSDLKNIYREIDAFRYVWDSFLHLSYLYTIVVHERDRWNLSPGHPLREFIYSILGWDSNSRAEDLVSTKDFNAMYSFIFAKLPEFVDSCINSANAENFGAALVTAFHVDKFRAFIFGENIWELLTQTLKQRKRKIVLTFDGFDTILEFFRMKNTEHRMDDLPERINFENNWLLSLVLLVLDKGLKETKNNNLFRLMHYCIAIPYDRFLEIKSVDRDAYRLSHRFTSLRWTGIELTALLRKRFYELAFGGNSYEEDKSLPLENRLHEIIKKGFPELPLDITINFNDKTYTMPLFLYVLRHTFWRPRDILTYYANLLSARDSLRREREKFTDSMIQDVIRLTTKSVLDNEFFNEFESVSYLKDIAEQFRGANQILEWDEISEKLKDVDFMLQTSSTHKLSTDEKIDFLYEVGFLGIMVPDKYRGTHHKYAFIFNEGRFLQEFIGKQAYKHIDFVIHPIFCEYLHLNTKENNELTSVFTWEYLHTNERMRHLTPLI